MKQELADLKDTVANTNQELDVRVKELTTKLDVGVKGLSERVEDVELATARSPTPIKADRQQSLLLDSARCAKALESARSGIRGLEADRQQDRETMEGLRGGLRLLAGELAGLADRAEILEKRPARVREDLSDRQHVMGSESFVER